MWYSIFSKILIYSCFSVSQCYKAIVNSVRSSKPITLLIFYPFIYVSSLSYIYFSVVLLLVLALLD